MRLPPATTLALLTAAAVGPWALSGCGDEVTALPEPVPLACLDADPLAAPETLATGNVFLSAGGPCGDIVYSNQVAGVTAQTLLTPGLAAVALTGPASEFSPAGDLVRLSDPPGAVYDVARGVNRELFEGPGVIRFLRDRGAAPRVFAVGCGDGQVRLLRDEPGDGEDDDAAVLAEDVVSCPAFAAHAPILLYQDRSGVLHRLDVSSGADVRLDEVLFSDGRTLFPGSGRSDDLQLSSDGEVVLHRQRIYGSAREWATFTRTSDGEPLGAIPGTDGHYVVVALPGGHVMAVQAGTILWVLDQRYEFHAYFDLSLVDGAVLANRQVMVRGPRTEGEGEGAEDTAGEIFLLEPDTGFRGETLAHTDVFRDARASASGRHVAMHTTDVCESGPCERIALHDATTDQTADIVTLRGGFRVFHVADSGHVILSGAFRPLGATVTEQGLRVYAPDGTLVVERMNRRPQRVVESPGGAEAPLLTIRSNNTIDGAQLLERLDLATGASETLARSLRDLVVAGDRLYFTRFPTAGSATVELMVTPR